MSRWVDIALPENYNKFDYSKLLVLHILPVLAKYRGANLKCVYEYYTDIEVKFKNETMAKKATKELNSLFGKFSKEHPEMLSNLKDKSGFKLKPIAMVMPKDYEKTGGRNIVRPDYSFDKKLLKTKKCNLPKMKKTMKNNN